MRKLASLLTVCNIKLLIGIPNRQIEMGTIKGIPSRTGNMNAPCCVAVSQINDIWKK